MRMFERVKCAHILQILSAGMMGKVCEVRMLKINTIMSAVVFLRTDCYTLWYTALLLWSTSSNDSVIVIVIIDVVFVVERGR